MASIANTVTIAGRNIKLTPLAATVLGTGKMTAASPIVVTVASHGLATGDYVSFTAITQSSGWTGLNGTSNKITKLTANTFSIAVDGSGFDAYTDAAGAIQQDFDYARYFPNGFYLARGEFKAGASDRLIVRDQVSTGPTIYDIVDNGTGVPFVSGDRRIKPFIMMAEQVIDQYSTAKIMFEVN